MASLIYIGALFYVLGHWADWSGGGGFGPRFFIECLPIVAVGLTTLLSRIWEDGRGNTIIIVLAAAAIYHQLVLVTLVDQRWLRMADYGSGAPLGFQVQAEAMRMMRLPPSRFFLPRLFASSTRQAAIVSHIAGQRDGSFYVMTAIAVVLLSAGIGLYMCLEKARNFKWLAPLIMCYMVGWAAYLLSLR